MIYFDDFTTYASPAAMTASGESPKIDGSGVGYFAFRNRDPKNLKILSGSDSGSFNTYNGNGVVLSAGDDNQENIVGTEVTDDGDETWLTSNTLIPINANSLYEYEIRLRKPLAGGGTDGQFAGFTVYSADTGSKVAVNGSNSYFSQHFIALSNASIGTTFETHRGYIKGHGDNPGGTAPNKLSPTVFESGSENGFFAPMVLVNYQGDRA